MSSGDTMPLAEHELEPTSTGEAANTSPGNDAKQRQSLDAPFDFADPMFSSDEFRMYSMKIQRCPRSRPHDWTACPFAHPGEKAKRRDPRKFTYSGTACADYRKTGSCARGDTCTFAHGVFECHLHPNRYRTQLCTDGLNCRRRVCFFAHQECELRALPDGVSGPQGTGSPSQIQAELAAEAAMFQGQMGQQAHLAQALQSLVEAQHRVRQEEAITAAAQLLDPMAKLRLLRALQGEVGGPSGVDPAMLAALSQLTLGAGGSGSAAPTRHSIDNGSGMFGGGGSLSVPGGSGGAVPGATINGPLGGGGSGAGLTSASLGSIPALARRSIDIGSLSRGGAVTAIDPFDPRLQSAFQQHQHQQHDVISAAAGLLNPTALAASSSLFGSVPTNSMDSFGTAPPHSHPHPHPLSHMPFTHTNSTLYRPSSTASPRSTSPPGTSTMAPPAPLTSSGGSNSSSGGASSSSAPSSSRTSSDAERSTSLGTGTLHSIDELTAVGGDTDESTSCSTSSGVARSVSAGSNLDTSVNGGGGKEVVSMTPNSSLPPLPPQLLMHQHQQQQQQQQPLRQASVQRAMSFDNILAELPRSASQVNMVGLGYTQAMS